MANPLINIGPGGPMEAGIASARHPESVAFWHDSENVAFRNLGIEKVVGPQDFLMTGRAVISLAQARGAAGVRRLYFQDDLFRIFGWNEPGPVYYIGQTAQRAMLEPYGNWLLVACNGLFLWKGEGFLDPVPGAPTGVKLIAQMMSHVIVATDDEIFWPDVRNIEDFAHGPSKTAGRLPIRDLESSILALKPLGSGLGIYTKDAVRLLQYRGLSGGWFGIPPVKLDGIGAVGPNSVCAAGFKNYGVTRNGVFLTDGSSFQYIDLPAMHGYLQANLDWTRGDEVFSFHNELFQEAVFFFPDIQGVWRGLGFKYTNGGFSKYKLPVRSALPRDVFDHPIFGTELGIGLGSGFALQPCFIRTKPLDAGDSLSYKFFDWYRMVGDWSGATLKIGVHNEVNADPEWIYEGELTTGTHLRREAVFLTLEISAEASGWFEISQIMVTGSPNQGQIF